MGILDQHLGVLVEPCSCPGSTFHTTFTIALTTGLDPDDAIHNSVVRLSSRDLAEAGLDIAPLAPLSSGTQESHTALVDDEVGWETLGLEEGGERGGVVGLIPRVAPFRVVLTDGGVEWVVVGHVGCEPTNLLVLAGHLDDCRELLGGWLESRNHVST